MFNKLIFFLVITFQVNFTQSLTEYVNPFIGTSNNGNTFPGAVVPWGMASVSPHNSPGSPSGYIYGEEFFYGFGHNHLSGTGCSDLGSIILTVTDNDSAFTPDSYKNIYKNESAEPGYYSLTLPELNINAEVTASVRTALTKFSSGSSININLLIDAGRSLNLTGGGSIKIISENEISGSNISGGFCGEDNRQTLYFFMKFNKNFTLGKLWKNDNIINETEISAEDTALGAILNFILTPYEPLLVKAGISYVSIKNAKENLEKEIPHWDFNKVKSDAKLLWENALSKITVEGKNEDDKIKFYTALYHTLIHPNILNDVNGEYPSMGRNGKGSYTDRNRYSVFSLWDTYRTLHPFLTLIYPEHQSEMIKSMIDMYDENGFLPKWELTGNETYMMVGDPAVSVIADSYIKGIRNFNIQKAFDAMLKPVMLHENEDAPPVRAGYHQMLKFKYIPFEQDMNDDWWVWGPVSTTLEYCFSDFAISQVAKKLGEEEIQKEFYERSLYYKNLFDITTLFMRPRLKNGEWLTPFDSLATEGSGDWEGSGGPGFVEGNAWNYTWFVPHDVEGLIDIFGGEERFSSKLIRAFKENHFTITNEPDISYPYLFTFIKGKEKLTAELVSSVMKNEFGTDNNGLPGNDDCGTISAWFIFSALGFYPVTPATDLYRIGIPLFDKITISLNEEYYSGKTIKIIKDDSSFSKIIFNDKEISDYTIKHSDLVKGGDLIFK